MAERFGDLSARIHAEIAAGGPAVRPSHHGLSGQPVSYCYRHMIFCGPACAWCEPAQPGLFDPSPDPWVIACTVERADG